MRDIYLRKDPKTKQLGEVYWCVYYDPTIGKTRRASTGCRDKDAAKQRRRELEREAQDPARATAKKKSAVSFFQVLEDFINDGLYDVAEATAGFYREKVSHPARLLGHLPAADLKDVTHVKKYIRDRLAEGGSKPTTIKKELIAMRRAMQHAYDEKVIDFDPRLCFPRFKTESKPGERWLTPEEFIKLLVAFGRSDDPAMHQQGSPHRQLWIILAVLTGANDSEADGLRWEDIDWPTAQVHIRGTKRAKRDRYVPLLQGLEVVLSRCRRSEGYIVGEWGNVRRDLHAACDRAGIPRCSPNDLRRTYATWMANLGVPENALIAMMGHTSSGMLRRVYAKLQASFTAREMLRLTGRCTPGVPETCPSGADMAVISEASIRKVFEILENPVLGPGIEPGTRGFSIRAPLKKIKKLHLKRPACTPVVPEAA